MIVITLCTDTLSVSIYSAYVHGIVPTVYVLLGLFISFHKRASPRGQSVPFCVGLV